MPLPRPALPPLLRRAAVVLLCGGLWAGAAPRPPAPVTVVGGDTALARLSAAGPTAFDPLDPLADFRAPPPAAACDDGATTWTAAVAEVAQGLARRRIPYGAGRLADCSGMAHRVLRQLGARCDQLARPPVVVARRARDLARWYEGQGLLHRVAGLADLDEGLQVGDLAFYLAPGRRRGGLDQVFHIGMVVEVERDAAGRVQRYALFHGRRPGKVASITRWHTRDHAVPLGNGRERMIAFAHPRGGAAPASPALAAAEAAIDNTDYNAILDPLDDGVVVAEAAPWSGALGAPVSDTGGPPR